MTPEETDALLTRIRQLQANPVRNMAMPNTLSNVGAALGNSVGLAAPPQAPPQPDQPVMSSSPSTQALAAQLKQLLAPPAPPTGIQAVTGALAQFGRTGWMDPAKAQQLEMQRTELGQQNLANRAKMVMDQLKGAQEEDYRQASLQETKRLRDIEQQKADQEANKKPPEKFDSSPLGIFNTGTGQVTTPVPVKPDKAPNLSNLSKTTATYQGKPVDALEDLDPASPTKGHTFLQTPAGLKDITGQTGHYEKPDKPQKIVLWGDDQEHPGKQIPYEYDETSHSLKPIDIQRSPAATLAATNKEGMAAQNAANSLTALEKLAKQNTYIADVAMADQFFNVIKPDSGARMNQSYIDRLMTPGPLKNKMSAWAQKLNQGQLLTAEDRNYMIEAARAVSESKTGGTPQAPTGGGATTIKPGGAIDQLIRGGK